jgi:hypothetical protein
MKQCNRFNLTTVSISVFLGIIIVFSGFQAFGEEWTAEQKEVWEAIEQYNKYIENGDVDSAMALIHENALDLYYEKAQQLMPFWIW